MIRFEHFHDSLNIAVIVVPGCGLFTIKMCPIFFNIYGMKLNEKRFSFETVIIYFWDKTYPEINFKSHLDSVLLCK